MPYTDAKNIQTLNQKHRLAKLKLVLSVLMFLAVILALVTKASAVVSQDKVLEVYPTPTIAQKSSTYALTVNGKSVFVNKYNSISYAHFAFAGTADIEVSYKEPIKSYTLSPKSAKIPSRKNGKTISLSLKVPRKLILHKVNGQSEQLYILADPLEDNRPRLGNAKVTNLLDYGVDNTGANDVTEKIQQAINDVSALQGVLYIPPGVYKTKQLNLKSNMTLYLAGGSVLEATKEINPSYGHGVIQIENVSNVKIMGRGVLYGNGSYWRPKGGWYSLIQLVNTKNIRLEDILLIDPGVPNVVIQYTENCTVYNAKILSAPQPYFVNTDGFDVESSRNITIDNVLYKGTDDATSFGGDKKGVIKNTENINVRNSMFYTGGGFKIGTTVQQDFIRNITYENIDVVYADELSGFWPVTGANFKNIYFKNIRVEDSLKVRRKDASGALFQWRIVKADWEQTSSVDTLGYIRDVYFRNLNLPGYNSSKSIFQGYDQERNISNITFDNLYIEDKLVLNSKNAFFDTNQYVDLRFTSSNPTIVEITAPQPSTSKYTRAGQLLITRTGDISQPLKVKYTIRGTAKKEVDYRPISDFVIIPSGANQIAILIQAQKAQKKKGLKTVLLSLENLPNSTKYLLGPNFQAVVNISH